jgi:hypothetical protein
MVLGISLSNFNPFAPIGLQYILPSWRLISEPPEIAGLIAITEGGLIREISLVMDLPAAF